MTEKYCLNTDFKVPDLNTIGYEDANITDKEQINKRKTKIEPVDKDKGKKEDPYHDVGNPPILLEQKHIFPYIVIDRAKTTPFSEYPLHFHNEFELISVISGSLTINIDDLVFRCCAGDVLLINLNVPHLSFYDECVFNKLQFSAEDHSSLKLYTIKKFVSRTQMSEPAHIFKVGEEYTCEIADITEKIINENIHKSKSFKISVFALLTSLAVLLDRTGVTDFYTDKSDTVSFINKHINVFEYIEQNYQNKITLKEISNIANVSQKHFCRMFKNALDASFTQYLISVRLFNAAKLLLTTDDSIINISDKCGFGSISHFNHKFKEFYNCSPKEYRAINRNRKS